MLRHYDEIGLFRPVAVGHNGYRRYDATQLADLYRIVALRELGFGLDDISRLLDDRVGESTVIAMLERRRAELAAEQAEAASRLDKVERHLGQLGQPNQQGDSVISPDISTKSTPAVRVAELTAVSPSFYPSDVTPTIGPLFPELLNRMGAAGVAPDGPTVAYYEDDPQSDGILVHAAAPILAEVEAIDGVAVVDLPSVDLAVCAIHEGSMDGIETTVKAMLDWMARNGLRTTGYSREIYVEWATDSSRWRTEIQLPAVQDDGDTPSPPGWGGRPCS